MTLRDLIESLHRIYLDPRVSPTTEVCIEFEHEQFDEWDHKSKRFTTVTEPQCEAIIAIAISDETGGRRVVMSALRRSDALAR